MEPAGNGALFVRPYLDADITPRRSLDTPVQRATPLGPNRAWSQQQQPVAHANGKELLPTADFPCQIPYQSARYAAGFR
jgi:hypothetical protein